MSLPQGPNRYQLRWEAARKRKEWKKQAPGGQAMSTLPQELITRPQIGVAGGSCHTCGSTESKRGWELHYIGGQGLVHIWECEDMAACWDRRDGKVTP